MKKYVKWISTLLVISVLSACFAIPEDPPPTPVIEPVTDLRDLSSAIAKLHSVKNSDELYNRLVELEKCLYQPPIAFREVFTEKETDEILIYMIGSVHAFALAKRKQDVKDGKLDRLHNSDDDSREDKLLQEIGWAIERCRDF
jgi:hypothetical protein